MSKKPELETLEEVEPHATDEKNAPEESVEVAEPAKPSRKAKKNSVKGPAASAEASGAAEGEDEAPAKKGKAKKGKDAKKGKASKADKDDESAEALKGRLLRLQADFENFRKRTQRERDDLYRMANEDLMSELLPVLDHFQLALLAAGDDAQGEGFAEGVKLVWGQLEGALKKFNLKVVDAVGEVFDPNLHEALSQAPSNEYKDQTVMFQHRCGYQLGNKLLRPAQVVISLGPGPEQDEGIAEEEVADPAPDTAAAETAQEGS